MGEEPAIPVSVAELEEAAAEAMDDRAAAYVFAGRRRRGHDARQPGGLPALADRAADDARRRRARPLATVLGHRDAGAGDAGADRHPQDRPRGRRAGDGARRGPGRPAADRQHRLPRHAGGDRRGERRGPRWFQLYWPNDDEIAASFVRRAEAAGYGAIVLTVDTFIPGWKPRDLQQAWLPFLEGIGNRQLLPGPGLPRQLEKTPEEDLGAATGHFVGVYVNPSLTWEKLAQLREMTSLPIVVKGILHPDDAREAVRARRRRGRRLQPRRAPDRRGGRLAGRAAGESSRRSASARRSCSTAASAAAPTSSRRWRWGPTRCSSAVPTSGAGARRRGRGSRRCCACCSPSST